MTTTTDAVAWVDAYKNAWTSNDADAIAALFTTDAVYEFRPNDPDPWRGREAIVSGWLDDVDSPDDWSFEFEIEAILGETAVVRAVTVYSDSRPTFDNLWFVTFDGDRASHFTEWYVAREETGQSS